MPSGLAGRWHYKLRYRPESASTLAAMLATGVILLLSWAVLATYDWIHSPNVLEVDPESTLFWGPYEINAYLFRLAPFYDSRGQRLAHQFALFATVLLVLFSRPFSSLVPPFARPKGRAVVYGLIVLGCAAVLMAGFGRQSVPTWSYAFGLLFFLVLCLITRPVRRALPNRALMLACLALVAFMTLPGALVTFNLSHHPRDSIVHMQQHYGVVIGGADRLAAGHRLLEDVKPLYGIGLPFLTAAFQHYCRPLDMADGFRIFQVLQVLYILIALYLFYKYSRARWLFCLLALLMIVPWYHFHHDCLLYPNQSAWRTLGFPIGLFAVYRLRSQGFVPAAYLLGCVGGMALLINLESGVASSTGLITYLYYRYRVRQQQGCAARFLVLAGAFSGGIATSILCLLVSCRALFGYWPNLLLMSQALEWSLFFAATGFGGMKFEYHLLPVVMFGHASLVLIHTALSDRVGNNFVRSFRACVAATIVVWFAYYANRPHSWNLSSFYFLYAFLFIDMLRGSIVNLRRGIVNLSVILSAGIITLVIIPDGCRINEQEYYNMRTRPNVVFRKPVTPGATLVSGVYLPGEVGAEVVEKAESIRSAARDQTTIYLSVYTYLIPKVSGVVSPLPAGDLFVETRTRSCYQKLLRDIAQSQVSTIYLDLPEIASQSDLSLDGFLVRLREDLSAHYQWECDANGWEVWRRRDR